MARAIRLAEQGLFTTDPNPRVGCVIVQNGAIVGEGWHKVAGCGHAEVNALNAASESVQGADVYVTLEPCSHFGRTPPCAKALIDAGVGRVFVAMQDPNPLVSGRGITMLREAGIAVEVGLLEAEAGNLNPGFIKRMQTGRPLVRLKVAVSVDGRTAMASGESQWITGSDARADVQRLRARSSAIVTGSGTVKTDNPALTVRFGGSPEDFRQPIRVILSSRLDLSSDAAIFQQPGRTVVATSKLSEQFASALPDGSELALLPNLEPDTVIQWLAGQQCNEVLVESGPLVAGSFIKAGCVDEYWLYMAPKLLGSDARPMHVMGLQTMAEAIPLKLQDVRAIGDDIRLIYRPEGA
ncbi:riboflavin biosynthesis protein RibD [Oleiphilus messinensis]|uniref:Riboflavin biosynthesis protein RibD n=2 Tax=Oleiphilus messinensis TaxID=141451 RepID=A0A1Y0I5S9_9GAMM|nr:riboflavin biosynthesis protein RibD [Oleiphilus messinensis]